MGLSMHVYVLLHHLQRSVHLFNIAPLKMTVRNLRVTCIVHRPLGCLEVTRASICLGRRKEDPAL